MSEKLKITSTEPVDLDDVAVSETGANSSKLESKPSEAATTSSTVDGLDVGGSEPEPPAKPARPLSPRAQVLKDLKDAFPQIEEKYVQACLIASEYRADPAFNALLFLLDPTFKPEPLTRSELPGSKQKLSDDELLARQLQKEFDRENRRARTSRHRAHLSERQQDAEDSPDEFEQLKESFTQGFEEAKTTLNGWVSGISSVLNLDESSSNQNPKLFGALGGSSFNKVQPKRNANFDEDPEILSLDFSHRVDMKDETGPKLPQRTKPNAETRWQPLNSDVPVSLDAFLVTDLDEEDKAKK